MRILGRKATIMENFPQGGTDGGFFGSFIDMEIKTIYVK